MYTYTYICICIYAIRGSQVGRDQNPSPDPKPDPTRSRCPHQPNPSPNRGSQAAWDSQEPITSTYMAMTGDISGAKKKQALNLKWMSGRDHEPQAPPPPPSSLPSLTKSYGPHLPLLQPVYRENDSIEKGPIPRGRPASPVHDMNVIKGNDDCAEATGVSTQLW